MTLNEIVDKIILTFCQLHDRSDLWEHTRSDPDTFRRFIRQIVEPLFKSETPPVWQCDTCSLWFGNHESGVETESGGSECIPCSDRKEREVLRG